MLPRWLDRVFLTGACLLLGLSHPASGQEVPAPVPGLPAGGRRSPGGGTPATSPGRSRPPPPPSPGRRGTRRAPAPTAATPRCRRWRVGRGSRPAPHGGRGSSRGCGWPRSRGATPGTSRGRGGRTPPRGGRRRSARPARGDLGRQPVGGQIREELPRKPVVSPEESRHRPVRVPFPGVGRVQVHRPRADPVPLPLVGVVGGSVFETRVVARRSTRRTPPAPAAPRPGTRTPTRRPGDRVSLATHPDQPYNRPLVRAG